MGNEFTAKDPKDTYLSILTLGESAPATPNVLHATALLPVLDASSGVSLLELSQQEVAFTGIMSATASGIVMEPAILFTSDEVATDKVTFKSDTDVAIHFVTADPEGTVVASIGSLALRSTGSAGSTLYVKEAGSSDTGWRGVDAVTAFEDLTNVPPVYQAEKWLRVNSSGNAIEYVDPPTVALGAFIELSDVPQSYTDQKFKVVMVAESETGLIFGEPSAANFTDLLDCPDALVADKFIQVNGLGTELILVDSTAGGAFIELSDAPTSYAGKNAALVAVNALANAVTFVAESATWGDILFFDGVKWDNLPAGTEGQVLTSHAVTADPSWEDSAPPQFTELTDTPASYPADYVYSFPYINSAEDGLEFPGAAPLFDPAQFLPFTGVGGIPFIDDDQGSWLIVPPPFPEDDPAPPMWLRMVVSNDPNDSPAGPGILGGYPEWALLEMYFGQLYGNNIGGVDDYTIGYALNAGGPLTDAEINYLSLLEMLASDDFVGTAPTDGQVLGYTTGPGVAWQTQGAKYYDRVREPVTDGDTVTPEILFDSNGDVVMVETTTEYTTHS